MMNMKKMVSSNRALAYTLLTAAGAAIGMVAAKKLVTSCCCAEKMKCKAKKAIKTIENKILD